MKVERFVTVKHIRAFKCVNLYMSVNRWWICYAELLLTLLNKT